MVPESSSKRQKLTNINHKIADTRHRFIRSIVVTARGHVFACCHPTSIEPRLPRVTDDQPRSVKILQQGPARSMGGAKRGRKPAAKKAGGAGKTQGGPAPRPPPARYGPADDTTCLLSRLYIRQLTGGCMSFGQIKQSCHAHKCKCKLKLSNEIYHWSVMQWRLGFIYLAHSE